MMRYVPMYIRFFQIQRQKGNVSNVSVFLSRTQTAKYKLFHGLIAVALWLGLLVGLLYSIITIYDEGGSGCGRCKDWFGWQENRRRAEE